MIGLHGGPALTSDVSLYSFFGYCLLVIAAILAVRVLVQVFRPGAESPSRLRLLRVFRRLIALDGSVVVGEVPRPPAPVEHAQPP
jgi:hypothetical protein